MFSARPSRTNFKKMNTLQQEINTSQLNDNANDSNSADSNAEIDEVVSLLQGFAKVGDNESDDEDFVGASVISPPNESPLPICALDWSSLYPSIGIVQMRTLWPWEGWSMKEDYTDNLPVSRKRTRSQSRTR